MTGINTIVFDLDGTLVEFRMDYRSLRKEAIETTEKLYGIPRHIVSTEIQHSWNAGKSLKASG